MNEDDRIEMEKAVKQALFTLINSTKNHLKDGEDGDKERLKAEIDRTLKELYKIAEELEERDYIKAKP